MGKRKTDRELICIAEQHLPYFQKSAADWKIYAKMNKLPSTSTYIEHFSSWANAKRVVGVDPEFIRSCTHKYEREYLEKTAKRYSNYFRRTGEWDQFAKKHGLPQSDAYIRQFTSMTSARKKMGIPSYSTRNNYTRLQLVQFAIIGISQFNKKKTWNKYAKRNNIARSGAYVRKFGSWGMAKQYIFTFIKNYILIISENLHYSNFHKQYCLGKPQPQVLF